MQPRSALHRLWHRLTSLSEPANPTGTALAPIPDRPGSAAAWPDRTPYSVGEELHLKEIRRAYAAWVPYESQPDDWGKGGGTLRDHLKWFYAHPSEEMDRFCEQVLAEATENTDSFWVHEALSHASFAVHPEHSVRLLSDALRERARLQVFESLMPGAASTLGAKAVYPNPLLKELIILENPDADPDYLRALHGAAYGGYISTATGFQPGFNERLRVQASGEVLSVEKAERFIACWRAEQSDATPR